VVRPTEDPARALCYPTRAGLADALHHLQAVNWPLREIADHRTYEAICIEDPDGNNLELCLDRPMEQWPHDGEGRIAFAGGTSDLDNLLAELTRS
jgi:catechol 2,3-dioxygenase